MSKTGPDCMDCKYFDYDEYWDPETGEESGWFTCGMGHYDHIDFDAPPCEDFSKEE